MGFSLVIRQKRPVDARRRAIAETSAFLSWAMHNGEDLPRIPRRRADKGGFSEMLKRPGAPAILSYWWSKALERVRER